MDYLEKSRAIKKAADAFLKQKQIVDALSQYREVVFVGSYATELMTWHDIDIQIVTKRDALSVSAELTKHFLVDKDVKHVKLINFSEKSVTLTASILNFYHHLAEICGILQLLMRF